EPPVAHSFDGFFIEAHAQALGHADIGGASVGGDHSYQHNRPLILRFHGVIGELRIRAIHATGRTVAARSRARITAACTPFVAGSDAGSITATDARAIPGADTVAASRPA